MCTKSGGHCSRKASCDAFKIFAMVSEMGTNGQQRTLSLIPGACISVALRLQHAKPQAQKDRVAGALRRFFEFPDVKQELPALGSGAQAEVTVVGTGWACEVCQTRGTQGACVLLVALFGIRRKLGSSYAVLKPPCLVPQRGAISCWASPQRDFLSGTWGRRSRDRRRPALSLPRGDEPGPAAMAGPVLQDYVG